MTREDIYDTEIAPLMTKIIETCKQHEIPMFATFQYTEPGAEDPHYCTTALPGTGEEAELARLKAHWVRNRHHTHMITEIVETGADGHKRITISRVE